MLSNYIIVFLALVLACTLIFRGLITWSMILRGRSMDPIMFPTNGGLWRVATQLGFGVALIATLIVTPLVS